MSEELSAEAKKYFELLGNLKNRPPWKAGMDVDKYVVETYQKWADRGYLNKIEQTFVGTDLTHGYRTLDGGTEIWLQHNLPGSQTRKGRIDQMIWTLDELDDAGRPTSARLQIMDHTARSPENPNATPGQRDHWNSKVETAENWKKYIARNYEVDDFRMAIHADPADSYYWRDRTDAFELETKIKELEKRRASLSAAEKNTLKKDKVNLDLTKKASKNSAKKFTSGLSDMLGLGPKDLFKAGGSSLGLAAGANELKKILDSELKLYKSRELLDLIELLREGEFERARRLNEKIKNLETPTMKKIAKPVLDLNGLGYNGITIWRNLVDAMYSAMKEAAEAAIKRRADANAMKLVDKDGKFEMHWKTIDDKSSYDWVGLYSSADASDKDYFSSWYWNWACRDSPLLTGVDVQDGWEMRYLILDQAPRPKYEYISIAIATYS